MSEEQKDNPPSAEAVREYLQHNTDFLQKNPDTSGNPLPTLDSHQMSLEDFKTSFENIGNVNMVKFYGTV